MNSLKKIHILILIGITFNIQSVCAQTADSSLPFNYLFQQSAQNPENSDIYQKQIIDRRNTLGQNKISESAYKIENLIPHAQIENLKTIEKQLVTTDIAPNKWDTVQDSGIEKLDKSKIIEKIFDYTLAENQRKLQTSSVLDNDDGLEQ